MPRLPATSVRWRLPSRAAEARKAWGSYHELLETKIGGYGAACLEAAAWHLAFTPQGILALGYGLATMANVSWPADMKTKLYTASMVGFAQLLMAMAAARLHKAMQAKRPPRWCCRVLRAGPPHWQVHLRGADTPWVMGMRVLSQEQETS